MAESNRRDMAESIGTEIRFFSSWKSLSDVGLLRKSKLLEWHGYFADTVDSVFNRILPNPPQRTTEEQGSYTDLNPSPVLGTGVVWLRVRTFFCVSVGILVVYIVVRLTRQYGD